MDSNKHWGLAQSLGEPFLLFSVPWLAGKHSSPSILVLVFLAAAISLWMQQGFLPPFLIIF
jgi:hypothetical protein